MNDYLMENTPGCDAVMAAPRMPGISDHISGAMHQLEELKECRSVIYELDSRLTGPKPQKGSEKIEGQQTDDGLIGDLGKVIEQIAEVVTDIKRTVRSIHETL